MTRQQLGLAAAGAIFLTVVTVKFIGLEGTFLAAGIAGFLYVAAWAFVQIFAEAFATVDSGLAHLDDTTETRDWLADMRAMKDTTAFDAKADLPRARLRSVPVQRAEQAAALPPADDDWLLPLLEDDPLRIPEQRRAGGSS